LSELTRSYAAVCSRDERGGHHETSNYDKEWHRSDAERRTRDCLRNRDDAERRNGEEKMRTLLAKPSEQTRERSASPKAPRALERFLSASPITSSIILPPLMPSL
jgi:hypothetical protein